MADCALVTVPAAGHSVPGDNPDGFTEPVLEFIERTLHGDTLTAAEAPAADSDSAETALADGPTLQELVESNRSGSRARPGAFALLGVAAVGALVVGAIALNRRKKPSKREQAVSAVDSHLLHPDLDEARERAVRLAGELSHMARDSAGRARGRLHEIEVSQARDSAMEIAQILGRTSKQAPVALRAAAASTKTRAARKGGAKAAKSGGSGFLTAAKWSFQILGAMAAMNSRKKKKEAKALPAAKRKMLPWRG